MWLTKFGIVCVNFATVWYTTNNGLRGPLPLPQAQFHQFTAATGHWVSKKVALWLTKLGMVWVNFATVWYTRNNGLRGPLPLPQAQFHQFTAATQKRWPCGSLSWRWCGSISPLCGILEIMACVALLRFHRPSSISSSPLGTGRQKRWPCGSLSLEGVGQFRHCVVY